MKKRRFNFKRLVNINFSTWNMSKILEKKGGALIRGEALIRDYTVYVNVFGTEKTENSLILT